MISVYGRKETDFQRNAVIVTTDTHPRSQPNRQWYQISSPECCVDCQFCGLIADDFVPGITNEVFCKSQMRARFVVLQYLFRQIHLALAEVKVYGKTVI